MIAEYQGNDLTTVSTKPLLGSVELIGDDDEVIELHLDAETAEDLISALVQFFNLGVPVS